MCNKFLKLEHIAHKKSSYALRMIMSEMASIVARHIYNLSYHHLCVRGKTGNVL